MSKFHGSYDGLKSIVDEFGVVGTWSETATAQSFKSNEGGILVWYPSTKTLLCQGKPAARDQITDLIRFIEDYGEPRRVVAEEEKKEPAKPVLFVVYGHDTNSRDQLELALTKIGVDHLILAKSNTKGLTIIEALEGYIGQDGTASAGIILLTPDDMGYAVNAGAESIRPRARQNVILELGMIMAKLGRTNTIIVLTGDIERPSDTDGILYLSYKAHVNEIVAALAGRLDEIGFDIDHKKVVAAIR